MYVAVQTGYVCLECRTWDCKSSIILKSGTIWSLAIDIRPLSPSAPISKYPRR